MGVHFCATINYPDSSKKIKQNFTIFGFYVNLIIKKNLFILALKNSLILIYNLHII